MIDSIFNTCIVYGNVESMQALEGKVVESNSVVGNLSAAYTTGSSSGECDCSFDIYDDGFGNIVLETSFLNVVDDNNGDISFE